MSVAGGSDPYQVLGVPSDAGEAEIRSAYRRAVREHPPDRDPEGFERVRDAYEKVRDPAAAAYALLDAPVPDLPTPRVAPMPPPPPYGAAARDLLRTLLASGALDVEGGRGR